MNKLKPRTKSAVYISSQKALKSKTQIIHILPKFRESQSFLNLAPKMVNDSPPKAFSSFSYQKFTKETLETYSSPERKDTSYEHYYSQGKLKPSQQLGNMSNNEAAFYLLNRGYRGRDASS